MNDNVKAALAEVGRRAKNVGAWSKEMAAPVAWALITWAAVLDNPRGWALSAGVFILLYVALAAWGASVKLKQGKDSGRRTG
jgi:hypothetical protein